MTEDRYYTEENFNLSYENRQKELRRMLISLRIRMKLSLEELAKITEISLEDLNDMELGNKKIELFDFAKIICASGIIKHLDGELLFHI